MYVLGSNRSMIVNMGSSMLFEGGRSFAGEEKYYVLGLHGDRDTGVLAALPDEAAFDEQRNAISEAFSHGDSVFVMPDFQALWERTQRKNPERIRRGDENWFAQLRADVREKRGLHKSWRHPGLPPLGAGGE